MEIFASWENEFREIHALLPPISARHSDGSDPVPTNTTKKQK
jgi:hypothetical protein